MKILIAHNYYKLRGGEDVVFESETAWLARVGHQVTTLKLSNDDVTTPWAKAGALLGTARNPRGIACVMRAIGSASPDVVHFHNVFPLLSPAVYSECRRRGVAVVQTLHNFRPICLGSLLIRNGNVCRACVNRSPLPGVIHRCYRGSVIASAAAARMIWVHNRRGTWRSDVDRYIALTEFGRQTFADGGFPRELIEVKPNFMPDPGPPSPPTSRSGVLFVGRLSPEKGVANLITACARLGCELRIAGGGPALPELQEQAGNNVTFMGPLDRPSVMAEMRRARVLAMPSIWFEGFPMVLVEAFACATPVVASRLGSLAELVDHGANGLLVPPGDAVQLADALEAVLSDPERAERMGMAARQRFLDRYTPESNMEQLVSIYRRAIRHLEADRSPALPPPRRQSTGLQLADREA